MDEAWLAIDKLTSIVEKTHSTHLGVDFPDSTYSDKSWANSNEPSSTQYSITCVNSNTLVAKRALLNQVESIRSAMQGEISRWKTDYGKRAKK